MKLTDQQYAALAYDVYSKPRQTGINSPEVDIGGVSYRRLEYVDRPSGYQGVLYQRVDDGQLIVAHRGTEFDRQPLQDGVLADGGMVATRHNARWLMPSTSRAKPWRMRTPLARGAKPRRFPSPVTRSAERWLRRAPTTSA